jgi:hypothetical protein
VIRVELRGKLWGLVRCLPGLDALAEALGNQVRYHTARADLFVGRPYVAAERAGEADDRLELPPGEPTINPLGDFLPSLDALARRHGAVFRLPKDWIPRLGKDWDAERLICVDNRYLRRPPLCCFQFEPGRRGLSAGRFLRLLRPLARRTTLTHLVLDCHAPAIPEACEIASLGEGGGYRAPRLRQAMQAISTAGRVITNAWWVLDLAVGYGRPVDFLHPGSRPWADPYRFFHGDRPPIRVHRGGCLRATDAGCPNCPDPVCEREFEAPGLLENFDG